MSYQQDGDGVPDDDHMVVFSLDDATASPSVLFTSFEQALKVVGSFGRYQITYILVLQVAVVVFCGNFVFMPYSTYQPKVTCYYNDTSVQLYPDENRSQEEAFCFIYEQNACENLTFEAPFHTIIEEWQLICSQQYVAELINTITVCGTFVAGVVGYFSDTFGRKTTFFVSYFALIIVSLGSSFAPNWVVFAAVRCVVGFFLSASCTLNHVWGMEATDQKYNFIVNLSSLWHFGYMITALLAYLTKDYKLYLIILNTVGAPIIIAFGCCFVESPRWLVQNGRLDRAAKLLNKIGDQNRTKHRVEISKEHLSGIPQHEADMNTRAHFLTLFTTPVLRKYLLTLCLITFTGATIITAFIFKVSFLPGNPFYKFFFYGLFRLITPIVLFVANKKISWFGRRHIVCLTFTAVLLCFGTAIVVHYIDERSPFLFWLLIVGAIVCNFLWTGINQYQMELFPTHLRNTAASAANMIDPIASALMPQILNIEEEFRMPGISLFWAELWTAFALIVSYWVLPETKGRPLPDTIEAVENLSQEHAKVKNWHDNWLYCKAMCCLTKRKESYENMESLAGARIMEPNDGFHSVPI